MKGESYDSSNIRKIFKKINKIRVKLANLKDDFIKQLVNYLTAIIKPKKINIEDLDISGMLDNDESRKLHRYIQESCFYKFRVYLTNKCKEYGIKLRLVNSDYPSTKLCKKCGMTMDRDENAAINIYKCKSKYYKVIA